MDSLQRSKQFYIVKDMAEIYFSAVCAALKVVGAFKSCSHLEYLVLPGLGVYPLFPDES